MKGKKGIIRHQQNKSSRNSDDEKLDQIGMALADIGINFQRNVFLVFEKSTGKLVNEGIFVDRSYHNNQDNQINNCDIVANVQGNKIYIELDGEAIHGLCDCAETITFLVLPTISGSICSYVLGFFSIAEACKPPL